MGVTTSLKPLARYSLCGDRDGQDVSSAPQHRSQRGQGRAGHQLSPTAIGDGGCRDWHGRELWPLGYGRNWGTTVSRGVGV